VLEQTALEGTSGWWLDLSGADFDQDGDVDLVAGNLGLNARYPAQSESVVELFADDFDKNGSYDIVFSYFQNGNRYPLRGRDCFVAQNPAIELKFPSYASFAAATVEDIYTKKAIRNALHVQAKNFASCYLQNQGNGRFEIFHLPNESQLSPLQDILIQDFDRDGNLDILAAGNMYNVEVVTPRFDGGVGILLTGDGRGSFEALPAWESGFFAPGDVKSLSLLTQGSNQEKLILVGNNNGALQVFKWNQ
jgi:hypothetical protein